MANEKRLRNNSVGGLIEDNPLTSGATTLTSAGLTSLGVVDTTNHAVVVLDPDGIEGAPEIVYVTAHTASTTTATILRAREGTTAIAHSVDIPWVHTATVKDFDGSGGGSGLIGFTAYPTLGSITATSSYADVDATNLVVAFTAPPSGRVLVRLSGTVSVANNSSIAWSLRESGANIANTAFEAMYFGPGATINTRPSYAAYITGLTAGAAKSWTWGHAMTFNSGPTSTNGPAFMEVWAVNL